MRLGWEIGVAVGGAAPLFSSRESTRFNTALLVSAGKLHLFSISASWRACCRGKHDGSTNDKVRNQDHAIFTGGQPQGITEPSKSNASKVEGASQAENTTRSDEAPRWKASVAFRYEILSGNAHLFCGHRCCLICRNWSFKSGRATGSETQPGELAGHPFSSASATAHQQDAILPIFHYALYI
eukprot:4647118-Pyramimonas_sp.AAC.1